MNLTMYIQQLSYAPFTVVVGISEDASTCMEDDAGDDVVVSGVVVVVVVVVDVVVVELSAERLTVLQSTPRWSSHSPKLKFNVNFTMVGIVTK